MQRSTRCIGAGNQTLAASARVLRQNGKSGPSSHCRPKPTCCTAHLGRLCAGSALCKLGRLRQPAEILCCGAARRSCRSLRLRGVRPGELTQCGTKCEFAAGATDASKTAATQQADARADDQGSGVIRRMNSISGGRRDMPHGPLQTVLIASHHNPNFKDSQIAFLR